MQKNRQHSPCRWLKAAAWLLILATLLFTLGCTTPVPTPEPEVWAPGLTQPSTPIVTTTPSTEATLPTEAPTDAPTVPPTEAPVTPPTDPVTEIPETNFEVHFIDVGQADAMLVLCDGKAMLIDGGNAADSNLMYTYLKKYNITHLDYVIATHVHEDHVGGIAGALRFASVGTVYCPARTYTTKAFKNFLQSLDRSDASITVPAAGLTFQLGSAVCTILAVNTELDDLNNTSIVMRIVYGETSFLFTGDAERPVEEHLLNSGIDLHADVLKVGHHGSKSSTSYYFLRQVAPKYAVIQVGKDNDYGHPTETVLSRLRDAEVKTFRTDLQGDIICISDGKNLTFTVSKNPDADVYKK